MIRPFLVLVIDIFVICICFEFRYSNFGFSRHPQMGEMYEPIRIFHVAVLRHKTFETGHYDVSMKIKSFFVCFGNTL